MEFLRTERLLLREATYADSSFIYELLNNPNWIKFIGVRGIVTMAAAKEYIQNSLIQCYETKGFGLYVMCLLDTSVPIGLCGFLKREYLDAVDLGYAILPIYEGNGYTTEAARAIMVKGASQFGFQTIYAVTTVDNFRSQKLLQTIGLYQEGHVKPPGANAPLLLFTNRKTK